MDIVIRNIGVHRGAPRLYLDTQALARAGFSPGMGISIVADEVRGAVEIRTCTDGPRRVSQKLRRSRAVPVIDLNSAADLAPVAALGVVRVVFTSGVIHVLALASRRKAQLRLERLVTRVAAGAPVHTAGIAFGAGVTTAALHKGLQDAGVPSRLVLANELSEEVAEVALLNNQAVSTCTFMNTPMQEAINDDWAVRRLPEVDVLEAGIPCSGASRAGVSKRGLARMEDHPLVGHLVAALIQWIAALQPAVVLIENVVGYQSSASAAILRAWLRDAGYAVREQILDARDFGSLEARVRWFLIAHPPEVEIGDVVGDAGESTCLGPVLDPVPLDDPSYREVEYLVAKQDRDAAKGDGFRMQWLTAESTNVPTLRRGYSKGGSTDPRLCHPAKPGLSRLLTAREHARIKAIPLELVEGLASTLAHQVCGQSVDTRPVRALGHQLGIALRAAVRVQPVNSKVNHGCSTRQEVAA